MIRRSPGEKLEIIHLVEHSELSITKTLKELDVPRTTFYRWYQQYQEDGFEGLQDKNPGPKQYWNKIPEEVKEQVVEEALSNPDKSSRELAWDFVDRMGYYISESSVYRILKSYDLIQNPVFEMIPAKDKFEKPTKRAHELWQTDFTQFKIINWGWYYLSTVIDDYSRFILAWQLGSTMNADDVENTLNAALSFSGVSKARVRHRPRLLSDNGPAYLSKQLAEYLKEQEMKHVRGAPFHPMTQGKIERWHRSLKNVVRLQHYYIPSQLEKEIEAFVNYYNHERYHESLDNMTPADVYFGRVKEVKTRREKIKEETMRKRRQLHWRTVRV